VASVHSFFFTSSAAIADVSTQEELVPKADPGSREARLEKKKQKGAYAKGRPDSPEMADGDLMGGDDSFKERCISHLNSFSVLYLTNMLLNTCRLRRERERREKRQSARAEEAQKKLAAHQAKEDAIMQQFRNLIAQRQGNNP